MNFFQTTPHLRSKKSPALALAMLCTAVLLPLLSLFPAQPVLANQGPAQNAAQEDSSWSAPVNLSQSGSALNPAMLYMDGTWNVAWYDEFAGSRYTTRKEGGEWSAPAAAAFPFRENRPRLVPGPDGMSFAYWIDARGALMSARARKDGFGNAWEPGRLVSNYAVAYDAALDSKGIFHIVYVTNTDLPSKPAGVYYRQSTLSGGGWNPEMLIYSSPYFRGIDASSMAGASVGVIPGETQDTILLGWNDPALSKVLLVRSTDKAKTWSEPEEIDYPGSSLGPAIPFGLDIATWKDSVMLVWKKRSSDTSCTTVFQYSTSAGGWSAPKNMYPEITGCPTDDDFLGQSADMLLYYAQVNSQLILAAWDGQQWSTPQVQSDLTGFKDEQTGRSLTLSNLQLSYDASQKRLYAVGSDVEGNKDIWSSSRALGNMADWFPPPSAWSQPQQLAQSPSGFNALNLMTDAKGNFHALWAQVPDAATATLLGTSGTKRTIVYYSAWKGDRWTDPAPVLRSRSGSANQVSGTISQLGETMAVWRADSGCALYFSRALAESAFSASEWMDTVDLPASGGTCSAPKVIAGEREDVYVAYAVPVNEGRGIYLTSSTDSGRTWSQPARVFDAQAAGWEMADQPQMLLTGSRLHMLWRRSSPLLAETSLGLGYAYSDNGGLTWSAPDLSVTANLAWAGLIASPDGQLLRVWEQQNGEQPIIVTESSSDAGQTWSSPLAVASFGSIQGDPYLVTDKSGAIHLIQMSQDYLAQVVLRHWVWYNGNWSAGESKDLKGNTVQSVTGMAAAIAETGRVVVLYAAEGMVGTGPSLQAVLGVADQKGENLPAVGVTPNPTIGAPTLAPTPAIIEPTQTLPAAAAQTTSPTEAPQATPSAAIIQVENPPPTTSDSNSLTGLILSVGLAVAVVIGVFGYRIVKSRR